MAWRGIRVGTGSGHAAVLQAPPSAHRGHHRGREGQGQAMMRPGRNLKPGVRTATGWTRTSGSLVRHGEAVLGRGDTVIGAADARRAGNSAGPRRVLGGRPSGTTNAAGTGAAAAQIGAGGVEAMAAKSRRRGRDTGIGIGVLGRAIGSAAGAGSATGTMGGIGSALRVRTATGGESAAGDRTYRRISSSSQSAVHTGLPVLLVEASPMVTNDADTHW